MNDKVLVLIALSGLLALPQLPVERVALGATRISLDETTFEELATRLGPADEMGAGVRITQFEAIQAGSGTAAEDSLLARHCAVLKTPVRARTDRGVALGLSRSEVERCLGGSGRDSSGVIIYSASEMRRAKDYRATAWSTLRLRYHAGRVVAFSAAAGITDQASTSRRSVLTWRCS